MSLEDWCGVPQKKERGHAGPRGKGSTSSIFTFDDNHRMRELVGGGGTLPSGHLFSSRGKKSPRERGGEKVEPKLSRRKPREAGLERCVPAGSLV